MNSDFSSQGVVGGGSPASQLPKSPLSLISKWQRYRLLLTRHWWLLFLTISIAVALQAWNTLSTPPKYISFGRMMVTGRISLPGSAVYSEEANFFFGTQIELMQSQAVRLAADARIHALHPELTPCPVSLSVSQQPHTSIFVFEATGDQPEFTQGLLDATMQEYINAKKEMRSGKSDTTLSAIADELKILDKEIKAGEEDLINFQKQNNLNALKDETNSAGSYLSILENKIANLTTEYQLLNLLSVDQNIARQQQQAAGVSEPSGPAGSRTEGLLPEFGPQAAYAKAKQDIQELKAELAERSHDLRPSHPIIVALNDRISHQEELIRIYHDQSKSDLADKRESLRLQLENLQNERKQWSTKALDLSGRAAIYETLKSKVDRSKALYDHLLSSMQAVDVNKNIDQDIVSVLENASTPISMKPGLPKALTTALAGGLVAGLVILFLLDQLDDRLISITEFESCFSERVLGRIPREGIKDVTVLEFDDSRHIFAEAFSNLRSAILYLPYDTGRPKTLLVTSAVPNEGKSTISSDLATTLALGGARTLLVDGDLRRGNLHEIFELPNSRGFAEVVTEKAPWRELTHKTKIENLTLLTSGKRLSQPAKDLLNTTTDEFLKEIQTEYDFIVFDTCPVLAADDTTTLAPKVDATLFVVRLGFSRRKGVTGALALLYERQVNVLGTILNDVNPVVDGYHYYSYSDYYYSNASRS